LSGTAYTLSRGKTSSRYLMQLAGLLLLLSSSAIVLTAFILFSGILPFSQFEDKVYTMLILIATVLSVENAVAVMAGALIIRKMAAASAPTPAPPRVVRSREAVKEAEAIPPVEVTETQPAPAASKPSEEAARPVETGVQATTGVVCPNCGRVLPYGDIHVLCPYCGYRIKK